MSPKSAHVLLVSPNANVQEEIRSALSTARVSQAPIVHLVDRPMAALEAIQGRAPEVIFLDFEIGLDQVMTLAREILRDAPDTAIHAVFNAETLDSAGVSNTDVMAAVGAGVRGFLRSPVSSEELERVVDGIGPKSAPTTTGEGKLVSFISNKGGVGKSTLSVNVACDLARRHPGQVLLIDVSLQLGVCAPMLGFDQSTTISDFIEELDRLDGTLIRELSLEHDCGLSLIAAPKNAEDAARIHEDDLARLIRIARRSFKYVVVDTFPMLDASVISILDSSDMSFVVFQDFVPQVLGAASLLRTLDHLGFGQDQCRLIVNRGHAKIPGALRGSDIESHVGRPVDHEVPYNKSVLVSSNVGTPFVLSHGVRRGFGKAVRKIVDSITHATAGSGAEGAA